MKSKKLAVLISILMIVVLIVVLASTIFRVRTISFNFLNQRYVLKDCSQDDYLKDVTVPYGDSIFLVDKSKMISSLEQNNPYLNVISVETTFPNNLVIHAAEREEVYAIRFGAEADDTFAVCDQNLKILKFCNSAQLNKAGYISPIKVEIGYADVDLASDGYNTADFINNPQITPVLTSLANAFQSAGYNMVSLKGFATGIKLSESGSFAVSSTGSELEFVKTVEIATKYGISMTINNASSYLDNKLALGLRVYNDQHDKHNTTGEIYVFENSGKIIASYRA